jgi:nicotinamidase-related amidase
MKPNPAKTCLLIIDMINEFTFEDADEMFPAIEQAAHNIAA